MGYVGVWCAGGSKSLGDYGLEYFSRQGHERKA